MICVIVPGNAVTERYMSYVNTGLDVLGAVAASAKALMAVRGLLRARRLKIAFGFTYLKGKGNPLTTFSKEMKAKTYWDFYSDAHGVTTSVLKSRIENLAKEANTIVFNLEGVLTRGKTLKEFYRTGKEGVRYRNTTAYEFWHSVKYHRNKVKAIPDHLVSA